MVLVRLKNLVSYFDPIKSKGKVIIVEYYSVQRVVQDLIRVVAWLHWRQPSNETRPVESK
jgi:hypothetical protein